MYTDIFVDIVNELNNEYHWTNKIETTDIKASTYIDFVVESNDKDHKFDVDDYARISNHRNISKYCQRLHTKLFRKRFYD